MYPKEPGIQNLQAGLLTAVPTSLRNLCETFSHIRLTDTKYSIKQSMKITEPLLKM